MSEEIKEEENKAQVKPEADDYKDKYIRLYAEFENARKRMEREKIEFIKYANEEIIVEFLSILDALEQSLKNPTQAPDAHTKGIEIVVKQFNDLLSRNGVKPIETAGKVFDHNLHEVLLQEESDLHEDGTILEEFQKGYTLAGKVIRTAKVKIAKKKECS